MRTLFVFQQGGCQPRLGECYLLQLVNVGGLVPDSLVQNGAGNREEAAARTNFIRIRSGGKSPASLGLFRDALSPVRRKTRKAG